MVGRILLVQFGVGRGRAWSVYPSVGGLVIVVVEDLRSSAQLTAWLRRWAARLDAPSVLGGLLAGRTRWKRRSRLGASDWTRFRHSKLRVSSAHNSVSDNEPSRLGRQFFASHLRTIYREISMQVGVGYDTTYHIKCRLLASLIHTRNHSRKITNPKALTRARTITLLSYADSTKEASGGTGG